jgi:hypothetical protein
VAYSRIYTVERDGERADLRISFSTPVGVVGDIKQEVEISGPDGLEHVLVSYGSDELQALLISCTKLEIYLRQKWGDEIYWMDKPVGLQLRTASGGDIE